MVMGVRVFTITERLKTQSLCLNCSRRHKVNEMKRRTIPARASKLKTIENNNSKQTAEMAEATEGANHSNMRRRLKTSTPLATSYRWENGSIETPFSA